MPVRFKVDQQQASHISRNNVARAVLADNVVAVKGSKRMRIFQVFPVTVLPRLAPKGYQEGTESKLVGVGK